MHFHLQILVILTFIHEILIFHVISFASGGGMEDGLWFGDLEIVIGNLNGFSYCELRSHVISFASEGGLKMVCGLMT
jgi:hypothetical protein